MDRSSQRLNEEIQGLLQKHADLIGLVGMDGHAYCMSHAQELLGGTFLNHLRHYDQDGTGLFLHTDNAPDILLPEQYCCHRCPPGTLLPTLRQPCTPCAYCGHITHVGSMREVYSPEFHSLVICLCPTCASVYPEKQERQRILAQVRRLARRYDLYVVKMSRQPGSNTYMVTQREKGLAFKWSYMPVLENLTFPEMADLEKIERGIQECFRPESLPDFG